MSPCHSYSETRPHFSVPYFHLTVNNTQDTGADCSGSLARDSQSWEHLPFAVQPMTNEG